MEGHFIRKLFLLVLFSGISIVVLAQKVAKYSFGKAGTPNYEEFSFCQGINNLLSIGYAYGKDRKNLIVNFAGAGLLNRDPCFKVKYQNGRVLYIIPHEHKLMITDNTTDYKKDFTWVHEGGESIAEPCENCVEDENEAMDLIVNNFMR